MNLTPAAFALQTDLGAVDAGCGGEYAVNDGVSGAVTIQVPASAASGDWAVLWIHSYDIVKTSAGCWPPPDGDSYRWWPVGLYVP
jgi:hypothetical protein